MTLDYSHQLKDTDHFLVGGNNLRWDYFCQDEYWFADCTTFSRISSDRDNNNVSIISLIDDDDNASFLGLGSDDIGGSLSSGFVSEDAGTLDSLVLFILKCHTCPSGEFIFTALLSHHHEELPWAFVLYPNFTHKLCEISLPSHLSECRRQSRLLLLIWSSTWSWKISGLMSSALVFVFYSTNWIRWGWFDWLNIEALSAVSL